MVASFQLVEEEWPASRRPRLPHDPASLAGLGLRGRNRSLDIGLEVGHREGAGMMQVGVQGGNQRGSFHDDPHACMAVAMNATLMPLGATKEPFQIQIVTGNVGHVFADEQAGDKGVHGLGHGLPHRLVRALEASLEGSKQSPTPWHRAVVGVERGGHLAKVLHSLFHGLLL